MVEFVEQYNNTKHSSLGMTPKEASKKENETKVWRKLYGNYDPPDHKVPKFSRGYKVRITRKKGTFEKGYTPRWTEEVFTVSDVRYADPITYKIVDYNNEEIKGSFTSQNSRKPLKKCLGLKRL